MKSLESAFRNLPDRKIVHVCALAAAGQGREATAVLSTVLALAVLTVLLRVERWFNGTQPGAAERPKPS